MALVLCWVIYLLSGPNILYLHHGCFLEFLGVIKVHYLSQTTGIVLMDGFNMRGTG